MPSRKYDPGDRDPNQDPLFPGYNTEPSEQGYFQINRSGDFSGRKGWKKLSKRKGFPEPTQEELDAQAEKERMRPGPLDEQLPFGESDPYGLKGLDTVNKLPVPYRNLPERYYAPTREIPTSDNEDGRYGWSQFTNNALPPGPPQGPRPSPPFNWAQAGNAAAWLVGSGRNSPVGISEEGRRVLGTAGMVQRGPRLTNQISIRPNPNAPKLAMQDPLGYLRDGKWAQEGYSPSEHRQMLADTLRSAAPHLTEEQAQASAEHMEGLDWFKSNLAKSQAEGIKPDIFKTDAEREAASAMGTKTQRFMAGFSGRANAPSSPESTWSATKSVAEDINPYRRANRSTSPWAHSYTSRAKPNWSGKWSGNTPNYTGTTSATGGYAGQRRRQNPDYTYAGNTSGTRSPFWDIHTEATNPIFRQNRNTGQNRRPGSPYNN